MKVAILLGIKAKSQTDDPEVALRIPGSGNDARTGRAQCCLYRYSHLFETVCSESKSFA
jgi:hypothetical protein